MIEERLKNARLQAGLSAQVVAEHLSLTVHAYRRWERGEVEPKVSQAIALADLFKVSLDELLTDRPPDHAAQRMMVSVQPGQRVVLDVTGVSDEAESKPYKSQVKIHDEKPLKQVK